jgi:hypothetical protein
MTPQEKHLVELLKWNVLWAKYLRDYSIWLKEQGDVTTQDSGGSNPPTPPPPPPGT